MPYIKKEYRKKFNKIIKDLDLIVFDSAGELNYLITNICLKYLLQMGIGYGNLNTTEGVLMKVKDEINRRITSLYENNKIKENGDLEVFESIEKKLKG